MLYGKSLVVPLITIVFVWILLDVRVEKIPLFESVFRPVRLEAVSACQEWFVTIIGTHRRFCHIVEKYNVAIWVSLCLNFFVMCLSLKKLKNVLKFSVIKNKNLPDIYNMDDNKKKDIICLNINCHKYLSMSDTCEHKDELEDDDQDANADEDLKMMETDDSQGAEDNKISQKDDDMSDKQESKLYLKLGPKKRKAPKDHQEVEEKCSEKESKTNYKTQDDKSDIILGIVGADSKETNEILFSVEEQLKKLDNRLIKLLAYQRIQQMLQMDNGDALDDSVSELILKSIDRSSLSRYGFRHIALPSELLSQSEMERIAKEVSGAVAPKEEVLRLRTDLAGFSIPPAVPADPFPTSPVPSLSALPVRATLCPVERPAR